MQVLFGLLVPALLLIAWTVSLVGACWLDLSHCSLLMILATIVLRTFLHTGLFVTAHDAMHGTVLIDHPRLNHLVGRLCTTLYSFLSYAALQAKHQLHHQHPATELDPDFCAQGMGRWYLEFMRGYLVGASSRQIWTLLLGMAASFISLHWLGQVSIANLLLFWVLPILLSSIQLFYFGTFLPHHSPTNLGKHRSRSSNLSTLWSLLTCYHFGYHWEHHEYPYLPWYRLPSVKSL